MPLPEKTVCPLCNGEEATFLNEYDKVPCQCLLAKLWRKHLNAIGSGIASAETILKSPLFLVEDGEIAIDRSGDNLFISALWDDLLPHLKLALFCKGMGFRASVVTDEQVRTVYVGNESYMARAKGKRDDVTTYNSLGDLVGRDFDLVILRLGCLGHKNIAAPGALKEALMLRESACLPTWVVEGNGEGSFAPVVRNEYGSFVSGCHSFSDDVFSYISRRFETLSLGSERPTPKRRPEPLTYVSGNEDPSTMVWHQTPTSEPEPEPDLTTPEPPQEKVVSRSMPARPSTDEPEPGDPGYSSKNKNYKAQKSKKGGGGYNQ